MAPGVWESEGKGVVSRKAVQRRLQENNRNAITRSHFRGELLFKGFVFWVVTFLKVVSAS